MSEASSRRERSGAGPLALEMFSGRRLHFVGIGGCGMSGLALIAYELGARVSGSDTRETIYSRSLAQAGLSDLWVGHDRAHVPTAPAQVVVSSAIGADNVERLAAKANGLGELHRSELLSELTRVHATIAVAGAHGKSGTSALLAHVLASCGLDPSYVVGALLRAPGQHAAAGSGGALVIEADESDRSCLNYQVDTAVVTNVDLDHVGDRGGYRDVGDVAKVLAEFVMGARVAVVSQQAAEHLAPFVDEDALIVVTPTMVPGQPAAFRLHDELYEVNQPGTYQLLNASLVVEVALEQGCRPADIRAALLTFPGLARRFELRGRTPSGARVYDDYAHHPAEIAAALQAAAQVSGIGRVLAVFQPHLFSRTQQFLSEFLDALEAADAAWVEEVYPARENPADWGHVSVLLDERVAARAPRLSVSPGRPRLAEILRAQAGPEDVIMLLGAGDITVLAEDLLTPVPLSR